MRLTWKLIILAAPLVLLGAGCVRWSDFVPSGRAPVSPVRVTCDYLGQTYEKGAARNADDGCNTCTCGDYGWSCTKMKCAGTSASGGIIRGAVGSPNGSAKPAFQQVCAENYLTNSRRCVSVPTGAASYELRVPLGRWWVYATQATATDSKKAWWTEAVGCGLGPTCRDHSLLSVNLEKDGDAAVADPKDWSMLGAVDSFEVVPSKRMDVLFYYPGSVFEARTTDVAKVEVLVRRFPGDTTTPYQTLGEAALSAVDQGRQVWRLAVPQDLEVQDATVRITDKEGATQTWRSLGWIRNVSTLN